VRGQARTGRQPEPEADDSMVHFDSMLDVLLRHARFVTAADGAALALKGAEGVSCRASCGYAPEPGVRLEPDSGICGRCFSTAQVVMSNAEDETAAFGLSAVLAIPICSGETTEGVIAAFSRNRKTFSGEQVAALTRIAKVIADQIGSTRLNQTPATSAPNSTAEPGGPADTSPTEKIPAVSPPAKLGPASDSPDTRPSGMNPASSDGVLRTADAGNEIVTGQKTVTVSGKSVTAPIKAPPRAPEKATAGTSVPAAPALFSAVTPARRNYLVPVIAVLILLIACAMLAVLNWRARQIPAAPPALSISQPQAAPAGAPQNSALPPENTQPTHGPAPEVSPDETRPSQLILPARPQAGRSAGRP
jgi:hypothetical protein